MEEIKTKFVNGKGGFFILENDEQLGEMIGTIKGEELTILHTEVDKKAEGKGYAKKLLQSMVEYAREKKLMVIPVCPYVHAQFKKNAELYADVWKQA